MTGKQNSRVCDIVDLEGFDYAFRHYSEFDFVKDEKFHELRKAYIKAAEDLEEYLNCDE